jgi:hypothetical protein
VRNFANQIRAGDNDLARFDEDLAFYRQMQLGDSGKTQIRASLPLPDTLAEANERSRRQPEAVAVKLQHDVIPFVGLQPQCVGAVVNDFVPVY